jgi:O-antigen/teichoic acid export membrane protein
LKATRHGALGRAIWTSQSQLLTSGTSFVINIAAAQALSPYEFGVFGLAFTVLILGTGIARAVVGETLLADDAVTDSSGDRVHYILGAWRFGLITSGLILASIPFLVAPSWRLPVVALALAIPLSVVQDATRYSFVREAVPRRAAGSDLAFFGAICTAVIAVHFMAIASPAIFLLVWAVGAAAGIAAAGSIAVPSRAVLYGRWASLTRPIATLHAIEYLGRSGAPWATVLVLGAVAGPIEVGRVRGAQVLLGVLAMAYVGAEMYGIAEIARTSGARSQIRKAILLGAFCTTCAAGLVVVIRVMPERLGALVLGPSFAGAQTIAGGWLGAKWILAGPVVGAFIFLRARKASRLTLRLQLASGALAFSLGAYGAQRAGAEGLAAGLAAAALVSAPIWMWATMSSMPSLTGVWGPRDTPHE